MIKSNEVATNTLIGKFGGYTKESVENYIDLLRETISKLEDKNKSLSIDNKELALKAQLFDDKHSELTDAIESANKASAIEKQKAQVEAKALLENANSVLASAKSKAETILDDARTESSNIVKAAVERASAKEKSAEDGIKKRVAEANNYIAESNETASHTISNANKEANEIISKAKSEANEILHTSEKEAAQALTVAENEANKIISVAKEQAERVIEETQKIELVNNQTKDNLTTILNTTKQHLANFKSNMDNVLNKARLEFETLENTVLMSFDDTQKDDTKQTPVLEIKKPTEQTTVKKIDENKPVQSETENETEIKPETVVVDQPADELAMAHALLDEIENQFKK